MAGNEWINGYLEAILDAGSGINARDSKSPVPQQEQHLSSNHFNPTKYFVDEVVSAYDETDLHKTWMKVTAMRNSQERNTRMENLCWRIWHLTRRKKQLESEDANRMVCRRMEREQGHKDATEELAEELSDGEKVESYTQKLTSNFSDLDQAPNETHQKKKSLYLVLISVHGLVRGENMELGRDSDTGGQVKYVVELARALASMPEVYRVDLLTRQITSPDVDWSYGEPTEMLTPDHSYICDTDGAAGESSGAYIVRIPCGPRDKYLRKELLWPHIQEFVDGSFIHILNMARVLGEQINNGERYVWPYVIHGHYADAGDIAALLSGALNVPMVMTGHSLGRNKLEQLLKQGRQSKEDINTTYKIMRRIEGEELALDAAELVITSTRQEIDEQWGLYDGFDVMLERIFRLRAKRGVSCHGRYMPRMVVIPPGLDFSSVIVPDTGETLDGEHDLTMADPGSPMAEPPIWSEIKRFFNNPHKPIILALSRPDPKKNITTLVKAFGQCKPLRNLANLTLIMGNRDDIDEMSGCSGTVLTTVLKLIDRYDLYGQVAYPKHHKQLDVPDVYRLVARTKGVFINPALVEPFGLTLIEAAAHGVPIVATKNGGPVDIHRALNNGLLVDPHDEKSISDALLKLVSDRNLWMECRRNGLKNIHLYSWPQHCLNYLARIALCRMRHPQWQDDTHINGQLDQELKCDSLIDASDISLRLSLDDKLGVNGSLELIHKEEQNGDSPRDFKNLRGSDFKHTLEKVRREAMPEENNSHKFLSASSNGSIVTKMPLLRRKNAFVVIAVDAYEACGNPGKKLAKIIQKTINATRTGLFSHSPGYILSTALSLRETMDVLRLSEAENEFDALICHSGSEIYYRASMYTGTSQLFPDNDYATHIEYRWGGEGLKKTLARLLNVEESGGSGNKPDCSFIEDRENSNSYCLAYQVKDSTNAPTVEELRRKLRMRGLRCHVMYCKNRSKLHVLPLLASRAQALRYLFVRWGADLSNMYVFVGETGDTDYEELLSGVHKTVILDGSVEYGCDNLLRGGYTYHREDVVPLESPDIVRTSSEVSLEGALHHLV